MSHTSVIIEADGGSRGNPGPAAYGAVLKDARTGEVIAEASELIGVASNNVAEYRGLIAGLELAREHAPDAEIEVRMDSKLVVEQMSGNWKVKHPAMRPLAIEANRLAPIGTTFTWVPREQNKHADRLVNEAFDGPKQPRRKPPRAVDEVDEEDDAGTAQPTRQQVGANVQDALKGSPLRGWARAHQTPTTLILVRHGVTDATTRKLFSGGLASANPGLNDEGRAQARATAAWLAPMAEAVDALVTSPVRRTAETAAILGGFLGHDPSEEPGLAEMEFGVWDGLTFAEVHERHPDDLAAWLGDLDHAPGGGESFRAVQKRVLEGRDRLVAAYAEKTVVAVSHVTPIKVLVADAVGAPLDSLYRMELAPASVTVVSYFRGEGDQPMASLRMFNARPTDQPLD